MDLNDKQKKILEILKEGELSTTKIAFLINANILYAESYLKELLNEDLIINEQRNKATYWRLKNG